MEIPVKGKKAIDEKMLATIEHHFAKKANQPNNIAWLFLVHKKCNR